MKIKLIEVPNRANNLKRPSAYLIEEKCFKYYYEELHYTQKEFTKKLKINHRVFRRSLHTYYSQEKIESNRRIRCSKSAKLRDKLTQHRGPREILVTKGILNYHLTNGATLTWLAREYNTTVFIIRSHLELYNLTLNENIIDYSRSFNEGDLFFIEKLEFIRPGITTILKDNYLEDKLGIAKELFIIYKELEMYKEWVKERIQKLRKSCVKKGIIFSNEGIFFNSSKPERILGDILTRLNLTFSPEFRTTISKYSRKIIFYDYIVPGYNLLIECDGVHYHNTSSQLVKDKLKTKRAKELGYKLLRFSDKQILKEPEKVKKEIFKCLVK